VRVLIAGGGTGGHVYPGLAVAEALRRRDPEARLLFAGSRAGMEASLVPASGVPFLGLAVRPPRSRSPLRLALAAVSAAAGAVQCLAAMARFRPQVVLATGGVAAVPAVAAAALCGVPVAVLEGNAVPGWTNRVLARVGRVTALAYEDAAGHLPAGRTVVTGLPIRRDVWSATRSEGLAALGLDPARKTVLVIGGSQGAVRLNAAAEDASRRLAHRGDLQIVHQVGRGWRGDAGRRPGQGGRGARGDRPPGTLAPPEVPEAAGGSGPEIRYVRHAYLDRVGAAYACADLIVSRCGANALAEITALGRPAILVPYPYAADDHQTRNAAPLAAAGAAVLLPDRELSGERLAREIAAILDTPGRAAAMAAAALAWGRPDAADRVAALMGQLAAPAAVGARG
jgi:UDP-N-acetylglucosamine--N-acetylmuramyl-(pentapeptide) pyrophosphoryl-undecaprenol N-acetylglucosamine transferase